MLTVTVSFTMDASRAKLLMALASALTYETGSNLFDSITTHDDLPQALQFIRDQLRVVAREEVETFVNMNWSEDERVFISEFMRI